MFKRAGLAASLLPALLLAQGASAQTASGAAKPSAKKAHAKKAPAHVQPATQDAPAAAPPPAVHTAEQAAPLPTVDVVGKTGYRGANPYSKEYAAPNSSMAMKTDTPILETPMSIEVVPRAVMDDQQSITLRESLQNVSGVQWSPVEGELYENYIVRGFDGNNSIARNGVRETSVSTETANLERVEVLKGPAAMLYGRTEPGGLINRVTKAPLWAPYYSVQQQFGSFDTYRTTVDATGPINGEWAYRVTGAYQNKQSYRDYVNNQRFFINPSITWKPTEATEIGLSFEYQNDDGRWDDGIPAVGTKPANVPYSRYLGNPVSNDTQEREVFDFHWSHAFNEDWKINQRFMASLTTYDQFNVFPWSLYPDGQMNQGLWNSHADRNIYSQNINVIGQFDTWGAKHTFMTGFDFYMLNVPGKQGNPTAGPLADGTAMINLWNPVYYPYDANALHAIPWNSYGYNYQEWYGLYLQDQIKIWDKLQLLLGGRYDWAQIGTKYGAASSGEAQTQANDSSIRADKFNPRFGILYQPLPWLSVYGNYSESLGANNGRNANGKPLDPQEGEGYEAGVKGEFLDGRLTTTVAYFHINKTNIAAGSADPQLALQGIMTTIGAARSQGIELDIAGRIDENWSLIANYAWTDTRVTQDGPQTVWDSSWSNSVYLPNGFVGNRLPLAPVHSANLWAKYEFTDATFRGLSFGSGLRVASSTQGDLANDFQLPGYVTWNMMASYKHKVGKGTTMTAQLNAYNILNHQYYYGADQVDGAQRFNIIPAAPVNFMGSLRLEY